jgi:hypothetical protein
VTQTATIITKPVQDVKLPGDEPVKPPVDEVLQRLLSYVKKPGETEHRQWLKVLIYGPMGSGKSVLLAQAPKPLIVNVEKGLLALRNHPDLINMDEVYPMEYKNFQQLESFIAKSNQNLPELAFYETFGVDSMSELHKRGLAATVQREFKANSYGRNLYRAETDDHTENNEHIRQLVSSMRDLNRHVVLTAHHRTVQQKDGSIKTYADFSEKLANTLAGIMDVVGYLSIEDVDGQEVRQLRVRTDGYIACKTRLEALPDVITNPTWSVLWDAFQKQISLDEAKTN